MEALIEHRREILCNAIHAPRADGFNARLFDGIVASFPQLRGESIRVAGMQPESVQSIRTPLLLLFGAVCMVLLIAATNVAAPCTSVNSDVFEVLVAS